MTDYNKCRNCKWLSEEKCTIGQRCVNPNKTFRSRTAAWKQPTGKACKMFERSNDVEKFVKQEVKKDEYITVNKNKLQIMLQNLYDPIQAKNTYEYLLK